MVGAMADRIEDLAFKEVEVQRNVYTGSANLNVSHQDIAQKILGLQGFADP